MPVYYLRLFERKGLFGMFRRRIDSFPVNSNRDRHIPEQNEQIRVIREVTGPEEFYVVEKVLNNTFQSYSMRAGNVQHSVYNSGDPEVFAVKVRRGLLSRLGIRI